MRRLLVALALIAWMPDALAGEYELPTLRGSEPLVPVAPVQVIPRWSGFYVGGQVGMGIGSMDFAGTTRAAGRPHAARTPGAGGKPEFPPGRCSARAIPVLPAAAFFVGYNNPWEGMIIGVDFTWSKVNYFDRRSGDADSRA